MHYSKIFSWTFFFIVWGAFLYVHKYLYAYFVKKSPLLILMHMNFKKLKIIWP